MDVAGVPDRFIRGHFRGECRHERSKAHRSLEHRGFFTVRNDLHLEEAEDMTQLGKARSGVITPEMKAVAKKEQVDPAWLRDKVAEGRIVITANKRHDQLVPCGIGEGLLIKVNANIGTSSDRDILEEELAKLRASIEAGADTVMDLSTGSDMDSTRRALENP